MAMLAEPRKKTKYRLQPFSGFSKINKRCDDDTNSFGFKMMASMGWAPGKGLGLNESGNVDPIKLRLKNDDAGLGYKVSEDDAVAQQSEFQALLLQLNSGSTEEATHIEELKKKSKKPKIKSLEKQSEQSSVRVHYKKFTRGKDLSRASEQDLRSILGLSSKKPKLQKMKPEEPVPEPEPKAPEPQEHAEVGSHADMYTTGGSSVDYFKKKFQEIRKGKKDVTAENENSILDNTESYGDTDKSRRRSVTWGDVDVSYVDKYIKDMVDTSGSINESLNEGEPLEEPAAKKKKKKKKQQPSPVETPEDSVESSDSSEFNLNKKKKKKKRKLTEEECTKENVAEEQEDHIVPKKKKKRKLDVTDQDEHLSEANNHVDNKDNLSLSQEDLTNCNIETSEEPKQKKKKKKNKKNQVSALSELAE